MTFNVDKWWRQVEGVNVSEHEDREQILDHLRWIQKRTSKLQPNSQSWSDLVYLLSLARRLLPPADDVMG